MQTVTIIYRNEYSKTDGMECNYCATFYAKTKFGYEALINGIIIYSNANICLNTHLGT